MLSFGQQMGDADMKESTEVLIEKSEAEVMRLRQQGWTQVDFANALRDLLEADDDKSPACK